MRSWEIRKWQDNIAEDIKEDKLQLNENLLNGILEVAFQLASLQEQALPRLGRTACELAKDIMGRGPIRRTIPLPIFPDVYEVKLFRWHVFTVTKKV